MKCEYCNGTDFRYEEELVGTIPQNEHMSFLIWICNNCNKCQIEVIEGKYSIGDIINDS